MKIDAYIQHWANLIRESSDESYSSELLDEREKRSNGNSGGFRSGHSNRPIGKGKTSKEAHPTCPKEHKPIRPPTQIDHNAVQNLMSLRDSISKTKRLSQGKLMRALSNCLGGGAWMNLDSTKYFKRRDGIGILRIANHYGNANEFASRKEMNGNYGIVFRMEERGKHFRKDSRVQYKEEVYFANIDAATEIQIINGLIDWIQNGNFTCPSGILTNESP